MRTTMLMTSMFVLLASGAAFAQSGQGGYLGKQPGATLESASQHSVAPPSGHGSGQGGYLGEKPAEHQASASQQTVAPPPSGSGSGQGGYLGLTPGAQR